jgi:hypothetical protein
MLGVEFLNCWLEKKERRGVAQKGRGTFWERFTQKKWKEEPMNFYSLN